MDVDLDDLSGVQRKVLRQALVIGFDREKLDRLLVEQLNKGSLNNLVAPAGFDQQVFELIRAAQQEGWTSRLVEAAQAASRHSKVKNVIAALRLIQVEGQLANRKHLVSGSLERTVQEKAGYADFVIWADKLSSLRRRICRIEDPTVPDKALGTGFLVAKDLVLTNYHVVQEHVRGELNPANLGCRFDYAIESGGEHLGTVKPLSQEWLVAKSSYSDVDPGDQGGLPNEDELDFALLRLVAAVGADPFAGDEGARGWITLLGVAPRPDVSDIVFIVQHPKGSPLKLAVGTILSTNANGTRIRYNANTEKGSSGSPCFNVKLDPVALHHAGDPDTGRLAQYNQGIPLGRILAYLAAQPGAPQLLS